MPGGRFVWRRRPTRMLCGSAVVVMLGLVATGTTGIGDGTGERAEKARLAPQSLLLDAAGRGSLMVTVGERGHILVSRDRGRSWAQADVPTRAQLTGVFMHDEQLGWAVGHDEVVLRTRDGGVTWERVHEAPEKEKPLLDVWFADGRSGLAVGAYGGLLATRDGGDSWEARSVNGEDDFHLNQIAAAADGTLYLAAEAGHLYRSTDSGDHWIPLPSPYEGSFFGLLPLSDGSVLAYGLRGHLYRSPDRGATWTVVATGTEATLTSALELGPGRFVVAGMGGTLLWSDTAGGAVRLEERADRKAIVALAAGDQGQVLLFGEGGVQHVEMSR